MLIVIPTSSRSYDSYTSSGRLILIVIYTVQSINTGSYNYTVRRLIPGVVTTIHLHRQAINTSSHKFNSYGLYTITATSYRYYRSM